MSLGIFFAFVALFAWGFGDFLIQKTTRRIGSAGSLFFITLVGSCLFLLPALNELKRFDSLDYRLTGSLALLATCLVLTVAAFFELEGLRSGKIAVIEPVLSLELPVTVLLSVIFLSEQPSLAQIIL